MRTLNLLIAPLCLVGAAALAQPQFASQTPPPAPQPAAAPTEPTSPASPAPAADSSAAVQTKAVSPDAAKADEDALAKAKAIDQRMRARGYKPVVRKGQTLYCRNETELGSHFSRPVCGAAEDIDRTEQDAKDKADDMQKHMRNPVRY